MNLEASLHSLLSFAWTLTRPTFFNLLRQNIVFSYSKRIPVSFSWLIDYFSFFFCYFTLLLIFTKIILLLLFYYIFFFMKIIFIFSCSGMFRNVPCSWFYRRPSLTCESWLLPLWMEKQTSCLEGCSHLVVLFDSIAGLWKN